jgi:hypothetical protein
MTTKYTLLFASRAYLLQLSHQENEILTTDFIENEIYDAIMQMERAKLQDQMVFQHNSTKKIGVC